MTAGPTARDKECTLRSVQDSDAPYHLTESCASRPILTCPAQGSGAPFPGDGVLDVCLTAPFGTFTASRIKGADQLVVVLDSVSKLEFELLKSLKDSNRPALLGPRNASCL